MSSRSSKPRCGINYGGVMYWMPDSHRDLPFALLRGIASLNAADHGVSPRLGTTFILIYVHLAQLGNYKILYGRRHLMSIRSMHCKVW